MADDMARYSISLAMQMTEQGRFYDCDRSNCCYKPAFTFSRHYEQSCWKLLKHQKDGI